MAHSETPLPKGNAMNKLHAVKNHVYKHRAKYAAATTLAVCVTVVHARGPVAELLADTATQIEATV